MLSFEARLLQQNQDSSRFYSSANNVFHGRGRGRGRGRGSSRGASSSGRNLGNRQGPDEQDDEPLCQLCEPYGHTIHHCWYRFNRMFVPPSSGVGRAPPSTSQKLALSIAPSYGVDTNWYFDSGATDNITNDLEKLSTHDRYTGHDQVQAANGKGMRISHVGNSIFHNPKRDFSVPNVLHVPSANKNLLSVPRFTAANDVFLEFHPTYFCMKDLGTKTLLLQGSCQDGLYPMMTLPQVHHITKPSTSRWHHRLGHPSFIVSRVLRDNNLSFSSDSCDSVCDACQQAKSHQLPYSRSESVSSFPLQLIFSYVWGPTPMLVGRYQYYVSFIDDYSKFTWIFLLKNKSDVFDVFLKFQQLVERLFYRKILTVQSDWGGEYQKLNSFFQQVRITHHVSCPHTHQQNGSAERKHHHIIEVGLSLLAQDSMTKVLG